MRGDGASIASMLRRRLVTASLTIFLAILVSLFQFNGVQDNSSGNSEHSLFCYVTDVSNKTGFRPVPLVTSLENVTHHMSQGQPFLVKSVSDHWPATRLWSHAHFQHIFKGHDLFSSTFSTTESPQFEDNYPNKAIYYGIFINSPTLAAVVARDYEYPSFIPEHLKLQGNEWIHWGHPPCGAKRHVDLTCTGRVSVQVTGSKIWRLYPLTFNQAPPTGWEQILVPLEVVLEAGDALVWFPGWEHETRIETGPSISLSLHFSMNYGCMYTVAFSDELSEKVGRTCDWGSDQHKHQYFL